MDGLDNLERLVSAVLYLDQGKGLSLKEVRQHLLRNRIAEWTECEETDYRELLRTAVQDGRIEVRNGLIHPKYGRVLDRLKEEVMRLNCEVKHWSNELARFNPNGRPSRPVLTSSEVLEVAKEVYGANNAWIVEGTVFWVDNGEIRTLSHISPEMDVITKLTY